MCDCLFRGYLRDDGVRYEEVFQMKHDENCAALRNQQDGKPYLCNCGADAWYATSLRHYVDIVLPILYASLPDRFEDSIARQCFDMAEAMIAEERKRLNDSLGTQEETT